MQTRENEVTIVAQQILDQVRRAVVGKDEVLVWVLAAILARGHILLEDIPGVGKTTMALAFSKALDLGYSRIQFTPDVLPSDITGYSVPDAQSGGLRYQPGAVLTNLFLADELNRATSRTQSALLEAMEEGQVTVDGVSHPIPKPFIVIATQNPVGAAGTQLLPDSQMDRFLIRLSLGYPDPGDEVTMVLNRQEGNPLLALRSILSREELVLLQDTVEKTFISDAVVSYIVRLIGATRNDGEITQGGQPPGDPGRGGHVQGHCPAAGPGLCGARRRAGGIPPVRGAPADSHPPGGHPGGHRRAGAGPDPGKRSRPPSALMPWLQEDWNICCCLPAGQYIMWPAANGLPGFCC